MRVIRSPTFNPDSDSDLVKLIGTIRAEGHRGTIDERSQLKMALENCLEVRDVVEFLQANPEVKDRLAKKSTLSEHRLIEKESDKINLLAIVANRIYEIRCRIVHSKSAFDTDYGEPILPESPDAELLEFDVRLMKFIASRVIIANGRSVNQ